MIRALFCVVLSIAGGLNGLPLEKDRISLDNPALNNNGSLQEVHVNSGLDNKTAQNKNITQDVLNSIWPSNAEISPQIGESNDTEGPKNVMLLSSSINWSSSPSPSTEVMTHTETVLESNTTKSNITLDDKFLTDSQIAKSWNNGVEATDTKVSTEDITQRFVKPRNILIKVNNMNHIITPESKTSAASKLDNIDILGIIFISVYLISYS